MSTFTVEVKIPDALRELGYSAEEICREVPALLVIKRFREGQISSGKAAEILDGRAVGPAEPDPRLLHGVAGLFDLAEHAVRNPPQLRPLVLEPSCQPVLIPHLTNDDVGTVVGVTSAVSVRVFVLSPRPRLRRRMTGS